MKSAILNSDVGPVIERAPILDHLAHVSESPMRDPYIWDCTDDEYFSDVGALSHSAKECFVANREHYRASYMAPTKDRVKGAQNEAMRVGTMTHLAALMGREALDDAVMAKPAKMPRAGSKAYNALHAEAEEAGKKLVSQSEIDRAIRMAEAVRSQLGFLIDRAAAIEVAVCWPEKRLPSEAEIEIWRRGKLDLATHDRSGNPIIVDLKTRPKGDAVLPSFQRSVANYGYHRQGDDYTSAWYHLTGVRPRYGWIAVDDHQGYPRVEFYSATEDMMAAADEENRKILRAFARWISSGAPAREPRSRSLALPPFHKFQIEG